MLSIYLNYAKIEILIFNKWCLGRQKLNNWTNTHIIPSNPLVTLNEDKILQIIHARFI